MFCFIKKMHENLCIYTYYFPGVGISYLFSRYFAVEIRFANQAVEVSYNVLALGQHATVLTVQRLGNNHESPVFKIDVVHLIVVQTSSVREVFHLLNHSLDHSFFSA